MQIAHDINGNRIRLDKGLSGFCPLCSSKVIPVCGEINKWHWRHENLQNCDSWSESVSEWHLNWQNEFPFEWQEVIMKNSISQHRADIKTPTNLVLEIQNSPISSVDIEVRERFYNKMIWLINADDFKHNIIKHSIVKRLLRNHENYNPQFSEFDEYNGYEFDEYKELLEEIAKNYDEKKDVLNDILHLNNLLLKLKNFNNVREVEEIKNEKFLLNTDLNFIDEIKTIERECRNLENEANEITKKINLIESLPNCETDNYNKFKKCLLENIKEQHFDSGIFIEETNSLFPDVINYTNTYNFQLLAKNKNYSFFMDFQSILLKHTMKIDDIQIINENYLKQIKTTLQKNTNKIYLNLKKTKSDLESRKLTLQKEEENLIVLNHNWNSKLEKLEEESRILFYEKKKKDIKDFEKEKFEIMKKFKGQYKFYWKNMRKSWSFSSKPKFLDFGDYIFKIIGEDKLQKMTRLEFVNFINNHK